MSDIDELSQLIAKELQEYSEEVDESLQLCVDEVTEEAYMDLSTNPIIPKKSGKYAKSFYIKKVAAGKGFKRNRIGNKKPQLTHLLERGHITRNGGRTKSYPHWEHAQKIADTLPERFEKVVREK